jgi:hypothetical protein
MDVAEVGRAVCYMANLPLDANVATMTLMATKMPFIGRGCFAQIYPEALPKPLAFVEGQSHRALVDLQVVRIQPIPQFLNNCARAPYFGFFLSDTSNLRFRHRADAMECVVTGWEPIKARFRWPVVCVTGPMSSESILDKDGHLYPDSGCSAQGTPI